MAPTSQTVEFAAAQPHGSDAERYSHEHRTYSSFPLRECRNCCAIRLERRHRKGLWQDFLSLFSVYPYKCRNCFRSQFCFVPSGQLFQTLLILFLLSVIAFLGHRVLAAPGSGDAAAGGEASYRARATAGELTPFEKMMLAKKKQILRNDDILTMVRAGVDRSTVLKLIQTSGSAFDLSPQGILQLKRGTVDEIVINSMIDHSTQIASTVNQ